MQRVPQVHQRAKVEGGAQVGGWGGLRHRGLGHQVGVQRGQLVIRHAREGGVREGGVEHAPVVRHALAHGALEGAEGPAADAGGGVGREVGGVDGAKRRLQRSAPGVGLTALGRVAARAVAQGRELAAAFQGLGAVDRSCIHARDGRECWAGGDQSGQTRQRREGTGDQGQRPSPRGLGAGCAEGCWRSGARRHFLDPGGRWAGARWAGLGPWVGAVRAFVGRCTRRTSATTVRPSGYQPIGARRVGVAGHLRP